MTYKQLCKEMGKNGWASHVPAACRARLQPNEIRGKNKVFTVDFLKSTATFDMFQRMVTPPSDLNPVLGRSVTIEFNDPEPQKEKAIAYDDLGLFVLAKNQRVGALDDVRHNIRK
jgi:hypothetical protein